MLRHDEWNVILSARCLNCQPLLGWYIIQWAHCVVTVRQSFVKQLAIQSEGVCLEWTQSIVVNGILQLKCIVICAIDECLLGRSGL